MSDDSAPQTREQAQASLAQLPMERLQELAGQGSQALATQVIRALARQGMPPDHPHGQAMVETASLDAQLGGLVLLLIRKGLITEQEASAAVVEGFAFQRLLLATQEKQQSRIVVPTGRA